MFEQESDRVTREYRSHLTDRILAGTVVATSPRYAHVLFIIVSFVRLLTVVATMQLNAR